MSNGLKAGKYGVERRLPYEKARIEEVRTIIEQGINPLHVTIYTSNGFTKITIKDIVNYLEHFSVPFHSRTTSFLLKGDSNEREALV